MNTKTEREEALHRAYIASRFERAALRIRRMELPANAWHDCSACAGTGIVHERTEANGWREIPCAYCNGLGIVH